MKFIFVFLIALVLNCASSSAGIATSNIPVVDKPYKVIGPVKEERSWITLDVAIFGIPFKKPPIDDIIDSAIKKKDADALINIRYWSDRSVFFFITRNRLGISAEAIKFDTVVEVEKKDAKKPR
ncbi:MAG: hypothetical protein SFU98_00130 [Leptospiraceae bacterium]|nr:hypothetical protein [Leptospiraceae bacterium]